MQFTEKRIAETFDYARFEPSESMEKIVAAFAERYMTAQKGSREKMSFSELSGENAAKTTKDPNRAHRKILKRKTIIRSERCNKIRKSWYKPMKIKTASAEYKGDLLL